MRRRADQMASFLQRYEAPHLLQDVSKGGDPVAAKGRAISYNGGIVWLLFFMV